MRNKLTALLLVALLAFAPSAPAQQAADKLLPLATLYDLDSTSYIFCSTLGQGGTADGDWIGVRKLLTTSGSSTTITALNAADDPFTVVAAGDEITFIVQGVEYQRVIITNADDDTITVDTAINLSVTPDGGAYWRYRTRSCGTAATDGWFSVAQYPFASVTLELNQVNVTGHLEFKVQCRHFGSDNQPVDVYAEGMANYRSGGYDAAQADNDTIIVHNGFPVFESCRVGMLIDTADDGGDTGSNAEQVTIRAKLWRGMR